MQLVYSTDPDNWVVNFWALSTSRFYQLKTVFALILIFNCNIYLWVRIASNFYICYIFTTEKYIHIYIYIFIHRQICFVLSELISVAWHTKFPKLGSKSSWLKRQSKTLSLSPDETSSREVNFKWLWITIVIVYVHPLTFYIH